MSYKTLKALCLLSDIDPSPQLLKQIQTAPDPETATRLILATAKPSSHVLEEKWRQTIWDAWAAKHPHVPLLPELMLPSDAFHHVPALEKAKQFLATMQESGPLTPSGSRLEALLRTVHLLRAVKGQLAISQERYHRFLRLPPTHQFYALWHADVYHVPWRAYSGSWGDYVQLVQDNIALLWDLASTNSFLFGADRYQWCHQVALLVTRHQEKHWLASLRRQGIAQAFNQFILHDVFEHYGLIISEGDSTRFHWTDLGSMLLAAEQSDELPCAKGLF